MKKYLCLLTLVISSLACNKTSNDNSTLLVGSWKMVSVKDNLTNVVINNPGNKGDVILAFAAGKLSGKTPSNDVGPADYTTGANHQLSVPAIGGTKVGENSWGFLFYDNMYTIESYSFKNSTSLDIGTSSKILSFTRQ